MPDLTREPLPLPHLRTSGIAPDLARDARNLAAYADRLVGELRDEQRVLLEYLRSSADAFDRIVAEVCMPVPDPSLIRHLALDRGQSLRNFLRLVTGVDLPARPVLPVFDPPPA